MKNKSIDISLVALSGVILLVGGMFITSSVKQISSIYRTVAQEVPVASQLAQVGSGCASDELCGWAWSSNIGWISFNSSNANAGSGGAYKVSILPTGALSGYAWSPNIGWIRFNSTDVSNCPSGSCNPMVNLTSGAVTGYARVLSMKTESGGGWLELSGTNHTSGPNPSDKGVFFNKVTKTITGFAWEPTSVGWVQFDAAIGNLAVTPRPLDVVCVANPSTTTVPPGTTITFTANVTGGQTPYFYNWGSCKGGTTSPSCAVTFNTSGKPNVTVTDSTVPTALSGTDSNPPCPTINVPTTPTDLSLFIGANISTTKTSHSLRQGNIFALRWENGLTEYETCQLAVTNGTNHWTSAFSNLGTAALKTNGNLPGLPTSVSSGVQRGNYTFTLTCEDTTAPFVSPVSKSSTATLRIVGASGEEF
jgi:hypothetical protein